MAGAIVWSPLWEQTRSFLEAACLLLVHQRHQRDFFSFFLHQHGFVLSDFLFLPCGGGCAAIRSQVIASEEVSQWFGPRNNSFFHPFLSTQGPRFEVKRDESESFEKGGSVFQRGQKIGGDAEGGSCWDHFKNSGHRRRSVPLKHSSVCRAFAGPVENIPGRTTLYSFVETIFCIINYKL